MIGIIDYEAGNLRSVTNALSTIGIEFIVTAERERLASCSGIILPGVGAAPGAMNSLQKCGMTEFLPTLQIPLLGICLGMQVLFDRSEEGTTNCLGIIPGTIKQLRSHNVKIPHMGWNEVTCQHRTSLWEGIGHKSYFYFAHSFIAEVGECTIADTDCGIPFSAAVRSGNFYGVQFHPEKSGAPGLRILKNFAHLCRSHDSS